MFAYLDLAEQAVLLVIQTSREQQAARAARHPIAEAQGPQPVVLDRLSALPPKSSEEASGPRAVPVDLAVTEVADEQRVAERAEATRGDDQAPRGVERPARDQP